MAKIEKYILVIRLDFMTLTTYELCSDIDTEYV